MNVLILGSYPGTGAKGSEEDFKSASYALGVALAREGMGVIIGSDKDTTADPHIVAGILSQRRKIKLAIVRPEGGPSLFDDKIDEIRQKTNFSQRRVPGSWAEGRIPQLLLADAVLVLGGHDGVQLVGRIAPPLEKPVLAIASFGGAAAKVWGELNERYRRLGRVSDEIDSLNETWHDRSADIAARALKELVKRGTFRTKARMPITVSTLIILLLLSAWVVVFTARPISPYYSLFSVLGLAGVLGTFLRNNLRMVFDVTATFSWSELLIEIGTGLILAFALALLYFTGSLAINGNVSVPEPADQDSFRRIAVTMTILGLGGGLMIEQAANRVKGWYMRELEGKEDH